MSFPLTVHLSVISGATGEETSDARPPQSRAGRPGDAVSLRTAGLAGQGADAAGENRHTPPGATADLLPLQHPGQIHP